MERKRSAIGLLGLLTWFVILPPLARAQTPSTNPILSQWRSSGCADFYPKYNKRELPDTPENEKRAFTCVGISPFLAAGCDEVSKRMQEDVRSGRPYTASELAKARSCVDLGGNPAAKYTAAPHPTNPTHGEGHGQIVPLTPPAPRGGFLFNGKSYPGPHYAGPPVSAGGQPFQAPTATPTPSEGPESSLLSPLSGTGTIATYVEFPGGEMEATPTASPTPAVILQPPDVSADASPNYNAEFLNGGLWIFNKDGSSGCSGTQNQTTPCIARGSFWSNQSTPFDPQIAWDPVLGSWIATAIAGDKNTLLFAYSAADNPNSGNWTQSSVAICPVTHSCPGCFGDQDVLGYGTNWVAIDNRCFDVNFQQHDDTILFLKNSDIIAGTVGSSSFFVPLGTTNLPFSAGIYAWRPSRDVSSSGAANLYLGASVANTATNGNQVPYLELATVCPCGASGCSSCPRKTTPGTPYVQTPNSFNLHSGNADDEYILPPVPIPGCIPAGADVCLIQSGNANITQLVLQHDDADGNNYLLTSFPASYGNNPSTGSEVFWFEIQLGSGSYEELLLSSPSSIYSFPTVTMDQATDMLITAQNLGGARPQTNFYYYQNFFPALASHGALLGSNDTYTGNPSASGQQRWGDYMSSIWDPSVTTTAGTGTFWTAQEYTLGGPDQSTDWFGLAPAFLSTAGSGSSIQGWSEGSFACPMAPASCTFTVSAPPGVQVGDMLVLSLTEQFTPGGYSPTAPSGWTLVPLSNHSGATEIDVQDTTCGDSSAGWELAHVYDATDTGSFDFTVQNPGEPVCSLVQGQFGSGASGNILWLVMSYSNVVQDPSQLVAYGFADGSNTAQFSTGAVVPPAAGVLVGTFNLTGAFSTGPGTGSSSTSFSAPQGTPTLFPETPLSGVSYNGGIFAADTVLSTANQTAGGYSTATNIECGQQGIYYNSCLWLGWDVLLPP
jgi:hypothetical protein